MSRKEFGVAWFLEEILTPTLKEFGHEPRSMRRALLACIGMFHFLDYLEAERKEGLLNFSKKMEPNINTYLEGKYKPFEVLAAVANAAKHKQRNRGSKPHFYVGLTYERPSARAGVARSGVSRAGDRVGGIEVFYNGDRYDLARLIRECLFLLRQYFPHMLEEGIEKLSLPIK